MVWAQGGEMNYYFIYGPKMNDVVVNYTDLTEKPHQLPPLWALGFHQCKWSYCPESNVEAITSKFRDLKIPCDAIYLDIDYMEGFDILRGVNLIFRIRNVWLKNFQMMV